MPFIIKNGKYYASAGSNDAGDIIYDNSESELSSTSVQGAITEIANDVDTFENNLTNCINDLNALEKKFYTSKSNVNLNDILVPGFYGVSNSDTSVDLNFPIGTNGILLVFQYSGTVGERGRQIFFRVGTIDSNDHQWYSRQFMTSSGTLIFGAWEQIVTDKVLDSALSSYATTSKLNTAIAKYLPLAGGTLSNSLYLSNGNVYVGNADKNDASRLMLENAKHKISFELSAAGNMGIFDHTDDKWLMQIPSNESCVYALDSKIATATDLAKYLPIAGGTMTGNAIWINNGVGRLFTDTSATYLEWYKTAKDNNNKTGIIIKNGVINMYKVVSGTTSIYEMYDTHNITASTSALTAGSSALATNAIHLTYS